ncbi:MAG: serine hydrolase domain-containing protein [Longimicrobiales bacterium]
MIAFLGLIAALGGCDDLVSAPRMPGADSFAARIDSLFADFRSDGPGASVAVIRDGEVLFARSHGLAELETGRPADCDTSYRLASVTKQFTARAIALLIADGRLTLDDRLPDVLPGVPDWAADVRIRHLVGHTSGLPAYESLIPDTLRGQLEDADVLALVRTATALYFPPGSAYRYSNTAYALLALIVERTSGKRFAEFLAERIFEPAGMTNTVAHEEGISTVVNRAYGYSPDSIGFRRTDQSQTSAVLGDGGVYSSITDLVRWDNALSSERFTSPPLNAGAPPDSVSTYGFGWVYETFQGHRRQSHTGTTVGFRNAYLRFPDARLSIIVLANRADAQAQELAEHIAKLLLPAKSDLPLPNPRAVSARKWQAMRQLHARSTDCL